MGMRVKGCLVQPAPFVNQCCVACTREYHSSLSTRVPGSQLLLAMCELAVGIVALPRKSLDKDRMLPCAALFCEALRRRPLQKCSASQDSSVRFHKAPYNSTSFYIIERILVTSGGLLVCRIPWQNRLSSRALEARVTAECAAKSCFSQVWGLLQLRP